jgi:hypothetical protein
LVDETIKAVILWVVWAVGGLAFPMKTISFLSGRHLLRNVLFIYFLFCLAYNMKSQQIFHVHEQSQPINGRTLFIHNNNNNTNTTTPPTDSVFPSSAKARVVRASSVRRFARD